MWLESLTGLREESRAAVHEHVVVDGEHMRSKINGAVLRHGRLETPTLDELRTSVDARASPAGEIAVTECVADVQDLHRDPANAGALFQVASQFNLLEMISEDVTPEDGIARYDRDFTQGPACAVAAGAGTIYRNYFVPVNGGLGQTADNQIDCLADLGQAFGNADARLWRMCNGYALASAEGLREIAARLAQSGDAALDALRGRLRVGIQWDTQVTIAPTGHLVTQAYCAALPIGYSPHEPGAWEPFARLVLEATYEATLCCGILNAAATGNRTVFLTKIGGGVFANDMRWICDAIERACARHRLSGLDVRIVSHARSDPCLQRLLR